MLHVPGKNIRSLLIDVFQQWLKIPEDVLVKIRDIINSLHVSSLMQVNRVYCYIGSTISRTIPNNGEVFRVCIDEIVLSVVAHEVFGVASTINAANYVYFLALEKVCLGVNYSRSAAVSTMTMPWTCSFGN